MRSDMGIEGHVEDYLLKIGILVSERQKVAGE
jgi:hypothetical protein